MMTLNKFARLRTIGWFLLLLSLADIFKYKIITRENFNLKLADDASKTNLKQSCGR